MEAFTMQINDEALFIIFLGRELNKAPEHKSVYGQENIKNGALLSCMWCLGSRRTRASAGNWDTSQMFGIWGFCQNFLQKYYDSLKSFG
jgi:hypothetical protein